MSNEMFLTVKHSDLIYDVGMHKGEDTDYYLKKGFRVVAFEANPDNARFCRGKFADAVAQKRLTIVEGAITETDFARGEPQSVKFYRNTSHSFWSSSSDDWALRNEVMGTNNEVIEVCAVDFAGCVREHGVPYYLKADIVGSEIVCLRALRQFENKPDYISIRSEKVVFARLEEEFKLFAELGYNDFQAVQQDISDLHALADSQEGKIISHRFQEGSSGLFGKDLPGEWKNRQQVLADYRKIFVLYKLFGDFSFFQLSPSGRKIRARLESIARRPLPGWYDTHARHSSIQG